MRPRSTRDQLFRLYVAVCLGCWFLAALVWAKGWSI